MKDTSPQIAAEMERLLKRKTPSERLLMGCSMFDFSKDLVKSGIMRENPSISSGELRRQLFLRFYESDFSSCQRKKIIRHLTRDDL